MRKMTAVLFILFLFKHVTVFAMAEGTRHITGKGIDLYFMNDKVFGSIENHPLWAIYNCGSDINGEIDIKGTYHKLRFQYQKEGKQTITGNFGSIKMALERIEKKEKKFIYHVFVGENEYLFSIRYVEIQNGHMVNSIIEGEIDKGEKITLTVDGRLCPFATTGIILIVVGSMSLS